MRLGAALVVLFCAIGVAGAQEQPAGGLQCSMCHTQPAEIAKSVHSVVPCLTCHPDHQTYPHPTGIPKPPCSKCHADVAQENRLGVHGRARAAGNMAAPDCQVCHGNVHEVQRTGTEAFRKSIPGICGGCHTKIYGQYEQSVHGKAVAQGIVAAPVCSTCHGEHEIQPPSVSTSPVNPFHVPETCGQCHGNVRLARRLDLPTGALVSYEASFHGLALKAGAQTVANCASCHGVHEILPSSDPRSSINPKNLAKTCGKCHPGAGTHFAIGRVHLAEGMEEPEPLRWVRLAYTIIIPLTIGMMLLHNLGDWTRKLMRMRLRPRGGVATARPGASFRMYRFERIEHAALALSFAVLVWTGFALKYSNDWWARPLLAWEAGWAVRGTLHRIAGSVMIALSIAHVVSLAVNRRLRAHWKSLFPVRADVPEALGGLAYNMGVLERRPRMGSHSYVEKAEYWAVIWGTAIMALTGVMLWANTLVLTWLPKIVLDVAASIHFYEAVLATLAIVVWHFYSVIFDPDVYPVDPAFLTGYSVRPREGEETEHTDGGD